MNYQSFSELDDNDDMLFEPEIIEDNTQSIKLFFPKNTQTVKIAESTRHLLNSVFQKMKIRGNSIETNFNEIHQLQLNVDIFQFIKTGFETSSVENLILNDRSTAVKNKGLWDSLLLKEEEMSYKRKGENGFTVIKIRNYFKILTVIQSVLPVERFSSIFGFSSSIVKEIQSSNIFLQCHPDTDERILEKILSWIYILFFRGNFFLYEKNWSKSDKYSMVQHLLNLINYIIHCFSESVPAISFFTLSQLNADEIHDVSVKLCSSMSTHVSIEDQSQQSIKLPSWNFASIFPNIQENVPTELILNDMKFWNNRDQWLKFVPLASMGVDLESYLQLIDSVYTEIEVENQINSNNEGNEIMDTILKFLKTLTINFQNMMVLADNPFLVATYTKDAEFYYPFIAFKSFESNGREMKLQDFDYNLSLIRLNVDFETASFIATLLKECLLGSLTPSKLEKYYALSIYLALSKSPSEQGFNSFFELTGIRLIKSILIEVHINDKFNELPKTKISLNEKASQTVGDFKTSLCSKTPFQHLILSGQSDNQIKEEVGAVKESGTFIKVSYKPRLMENASVNFTEYIPIFEDERIILLHRYTAILNYCYANLPWYYYDDKISTKEELLDLCLKNLYDPDGEACLRLLKNPTKLDCIISEENSGSLKISSGSDEETDSFSNNNNAEWTSIMDKIEGTAQDLSFDSSKTKVFVSDQSNSNQYISEGTDLQEYYISMKYFTIYDKQEKIYKKNNIVFNLDESIFSFLRNSSFAKFDHCFMIFEEEISHVAKVLQDTQTKLTETKEWDSKAIIESLISVESINFHLGDVYYDALLRLDPNKRVANMYELAERIIREAHMASKFSLKVKAQKKAGNYVMLKILPFTYQSYQKLISTNKKLKHMLLGVSGEFTYLFCTDEEIKYYPFTKGYATYKPEFTQGYLIKTTLPSIKLEVLQQAAANYPNDLPNPLNVKTCFNERLQVWELRHAIIQDGEVIYKETINMLLNKVSTHPLYLQSYKTEFYLDVGLQVADDSMNEIIVESVISRNGEAYRFNIHNETESEENSKIKVENLPVSHFSLKRVSKRIMLTQLSNDGSYSFFYKNVACIDGVLQEGSVSRSYVNFNTSAELMFNCTHSARIGSFGFFFIQPPGQDPYYAVYNFDQKRKISKRHPEINQIEKKYKIDPPKIESLNVNSRLSTLFVNLKTSMSKIEIARLITENGENVGELAITGDYRKPLTYERIPAYKLKRTLNQCELIRENENESDEIIYRLSAPLTGKIYSSQCKSFIFTRANGVKEVVAEPDLDANLNQIKLEKENTEIRIDNKINLTKFDENAQKLDSELKEIKFVLQKDLNVIIEERGNLDHFEYLPNDKLGAVHSYIQNSFLRLKNVIASEHLNVAGVIHAKRDLLFRRALPVKQLKEIVKTGIKPIPLSRLRSSRINQLINPLDSGQRRKNIQKPFDKIISFETFNEMSDPASLIYFHKLGTKLPIKNKTSNRIERYVDNGIFYSYESCADEDYETVFDNALLDMLKLPKKQEKKSFNQRAESIRHKQETLRNFVMNCPHDDLLVDVLIVGEVKTSQTEKSAAALFVTQRHYTTYTYEGLAPILGHQDGISISECLLESDLFTDEDRLIIRRISCVVAALFRESIVSRDSTSAMLTAELNSQKANLDLINLSVHKEGDDYWKRLGFSISKMRIYDIVIRKHNMSATFIKEMGDIYLKYGHSPYFKLNIDASQHMTPHNTGKDLDFIQNHGNFDSHGHRIIERGELRKYFNLRPSGKRFQND